MATKFKAQELGKKARRHGKVAWKLLLLPVAAAATVAAAAAAVGRDPGYGARS